MGLDVSHGAYRGSYTSFHNLRLAVCAAAGVTWSDDGTYPNTVAEGLRIFLAHSDCYGEISAQDCEKVAASLREVLPNVAADWRPHVLQFIHGAEKAAMSGDVLEFS